MRTYQGLSAVMVLALACGLAGATSAVAERTGDSRPRRCNGAASTVFLCHTFCELGAVRFADVAEQLRAFLDDHPHDVVVIVIEDYVAADRIRAVLDVVDELNRRRA